jgi:hypothetical protein
LAGPPHGARALGARLADGLTIEDRAFRSLLRAAALSGGANDRENVYSNAFGLFWESRSLEQFSFA